MMDAVNPLDPVIGHPIRFAKVGSRWMIGNRPTRLAADIVDTDHCVVVVEIDPATGNEVDTTMVVAVSAVG